MFHVIPCDSMCQVACAVPESKTMELLSQTKAAQTTDQVPRETLKSNIKQHKKRRGAD